MPLKLPTPLPAWWWKTGWNTARPSGMRYSNWGCLPEYYPPALDLVLDGRINLANFVERHPLAQINEVFEAAHAHKLTRRAILTP